MAVPDAAAYPAVDQVIWEMERTGSGHYLHIGAALEFEGPPPRLDAVREHVLRRSAGLPQAADGGTALRDRVRELRLAPGAKPYDALLDAPVPGVGRPWGVWLVHGHEPGRHLLAYRGHHGLHDGVSMARLLPVLFGAEERTGEVGTDRPAATGRPAVPPLTARLPAQARQAAASLRLFLPPPRTALTPGPRAGRRVLSTASVSVDLLRSTARRLGCSVLDVHLSALSRTAQRTDRTGWTTELGRPRGIAVPVSLARTGRDPYPGNRFSVVLLDVPYDEPDLARRARLLSRQTRRCREPATRWALGDALGRLGVAGTRAVSDRIFARTGVQTTVLTTSADLGFAGRPAVRLTGLNCLPADFPYQPVLALWRDEAVCSFTADASVPDAAVLAGHWREAVDVLVRDAGGAGAARAG
ncbi:hypothetical protein ACQKM2_13620 [Streptomyces sp. NPDC004126]|uniref:hypothetical protein n=1 Tax=Streptomyces sp. NPDC004126 TaxID=3390695 RepID=UPI003D04003B